MIGELRASVSSFKTKVAASSSLGSVYLKVSTLKRTFLGIYSSENHLNENVETCMEKEAFPPLTASTGR